MKALLRRAKIYERLDKLEECFEDLGAVLVCDRFENQEALSMYDRVLKLVAERKALRLIKVLYCIATSYIFYFVFFQNTEHAQFSQHRFNQLSAEMYCDPVLNDMKEAKEVSEEASLYEKVIASLNAGAFKEGYEMLSEIDQLQPGNETAKLHLVKGSLAMATNRYTEATNELNLVINDENCDKDVKVNALVKRAVVEQCTGVTSESMETLKQAREIDGSNVDVIFHLALMHLISEKLEEGIKLLDECVALEPDHVAKIKKAMFGKNIDFISS